jgi:isocitrate dehydrogenase
VNSKNIPITIAYGDGIGPEIMDCTLQILKESGAKISLNIIEIGENIYKKGFRNGLMPSSFEELNSTKIFLKAPIIMPEGKYEDLNFAICRKFSIHSNIRIVKSRNIDLAIICDNENEFYFGSERRNTVDSYQITRTININNCQKVITQAFEYAIKNNRQKITCCTKSDIAAMTDGVFHKIFNETAREYPDIESEHCIFDKAVAILVKNPTSFDVVVAPNIYGNIIYNLASEISKPQAPIPLINIGDDFAMFEVGCNYSSQTANLSSLTQAAILMLDHVGQFQVANRIQNALNKTDDLDLECDEFTKEIISNLEEGYLEEPNFGTNFNEDDQKKYEIINGNTQQSLVGFDLFIDWRNSFEDLITKINQMGSELFEIKAISAKGLLMWPHIDANNRPEYVQGQTILRFVGKGITGKNSVDIVNKKKLIEHQNLVDILEMFVKNEINFIKFEGLFLFDGEAGYGPLQGE